MGPFPRQRVGIEQNRLAASGGGRAAGGAGSGAVAEVSRAREGGWIPGTVPSLG